MRPYLAEAVGTFAIVLAGTGAIVVNAVSGGVITHVGIALTFGLVVMAMIFALGDISGAHFNPAVTFAFALARRLSWRTLLPYTGVNWSEPSWRVVSSGSRFLRARRWVPRLRLVPPCSHLPSRRP